MQARLASVLADLDRAKSHLLRSGVPKAAIPLILGASIGGCGESKALYAGPCDGDCGYGAGGVGGVLTGSGGSGGETGSGGDAGSGGESALGGQGGGGQGGAGGTGGAGGA